MTRIERIKNFRPSWPGVLLFAALLAQAPHAGFVFMRNAEGSTGLEFAFAGLGAVVYAIALEGATAFFVWKRAKWWALLFAAFSILHNVSFYLPSEWSFDVYGANMIVRNVMGAVLISFSLPIAIYAFSRTAHREDANTDTNTDTDTNTQQLDAKVDEVAAKVDEVEPEAQHEGEVEPVDTGTKTITVKVVKQASYEELPERVRVAYELRSKGMTQKQIADELSVSTRTVQKYLKEGEATNTNTIVEALPELVPVHTNGTNGFASH